MQPWLKRATEEAYLFNAAFCTMLIAKATEEYTKKSNSDFPYALVFLVLPIVLHPPTRKALPNSTVTALIPWLQANREQLIDFPERVKRLSYITREALLFGLQHEVLVLTETGEMRIGKEHKNATERRTPLFTAEARECLDRAGFIGRWFAMVGSTVTIYASWGIIP